MDIELTSHGIAHAAAHSSMPEQGYNAIDPLMKLLVQANQIFRNTDKANTELGRLTFNTTVFNGDQVNSIPAQASAKVNVRTIPESIMTSWRTAWRKWWLLLTGREQNSNWISICLSRQFRQPVIHVLSTWPNRLAVSTPVKRCRPLPSNR